jgi:SAM-dependent methyltransferase
VHPEILSAFERICRAHAPVAARVLEVGAVPQADTLLNLPALRQAGLRVGVNLNVAQPDAGNAFVEVAADGLAAFTDGSFDLVLCNATLEHDAQFWLTVAGIKRVARPGALIIIGVPGYTVLPPPPLLRLAQRAAQVPGLAQLLARMAPGWESATPVLAVHNYPGDYYRFSPQAMREVLLAGCRDVNVSIEMRPPRIIGFGWRI